MTRNTLSLSGLFLLFCLLSASCGAPQSRQAEGGADGPTAVDALGRTISLREPAKRIVTIAPGATEVVVAAGGLDRIIAVSNVDSSPEEVLSLPTLSVLPLDFEAVVELKPDLVFASSQVNDPQHVKVFESLGIQVFYLAGSSWDEVVDSIVKAGTLMGTEEHALQSKTSLEARVDHLVQLTGEVSDRPIGIFLISDVTSYSFGQGSYVLDLFDWAGIVAATADLPTPAPVLSDEWVLMENPDVILGSFAEGFVPTDLLTHHPSWETLDAVRQGSVYSIPQNLILRPGPGNVDAAYMMARMVHPELFQPESEEVVE